MIRTLSSTKTTHGGSNQKQKDQAAAIHKVYKRPLLQWNDQRERQLLNSFYTSLGKEPSPTPSTGARYAMHHQKVVRRMSKLRIGQTPDQEVAESSAANDAASDTTDACLVRSGDVSTSQEDDVVTAAVIFNSHNPSHPYCQTAVRQLTEQIFSDDHFDAAISLRTGKITERLVGYGLDISKSELVAADLMDSAHHSKATRLGRTLVDQMSLHAFLEDVKSGVAVPNVSDVLRMWQRDLEMQMSEGQHAPASDPRPVRQLASPVSLRSSVGPADIPHCTTTAPSESPMAPDEDIQRGLVYDVSEHNDQGDIHGDVYDTQLMSGALPDPTESPASPFSQPPQHRKMDTQQEHENDAASEASGETTRIFVEQPPDRHHQVRIDKLSQRFPNPLSVFIYHAQMLSRKKCTSQRPGSPTVTKKAKALWSRLGETDQNEWHRLCKQLQSGDSAPLEPAIGADILERQGLLEKLKASQMSPQSVKSSSSAAIKSSPPAESQPTQARTSYVSGLFASTPRGPGRTASKKSRSATPHSQSPRHRPGLKWRKSPHSRRPSDSFQHKGKQPAQSTKAIVVTCHDDSMNASRVAFIMLTPDSPVKSVEPAVFQDACIAKFGDHIHADRCVELHRRVWVAQFKDVDVARQLTAEGVSIVYRDTVVFGEAFPRATKMVECTFMEEDISAEDLSRAVADALSSDACRLFKYSDRHYVIAFDTRRCVFRMYVPVAWRRGKPVSYLRFQPVDSEAVCRVCGKFHPDVCGMAEEVHLRHRVY